MPKLRFGRMIGPKAVMITAVLLALMVGTSWAAHRPTPLMDYAPQETGIYDTYYDYLKEVDCRYCHGVTLADRHHYTPDGIAGLCDRCHLPGPPPDFGVTIYRDCRHSGDIQCHGNFDNGWHHTNYLAASAQCTACHNPQILGELGPFQDPALYPPTVVTPSPYSCENCHWSQGITGKHPSTDIHYDPWGAKVANFSIPQFASQAGEWQENSPTDNGFHYSLDPLSNNKPVLDNMGTHHMNMEGAVAPQCGFCHANDPGSPSWDPDDPILIRYCERCHDIKSLHRIPGHVSSVEAWYGFMWGNNNMAWEAAEITGTPDATVYRSFSRNDRCMGCHGDTIWGMTPPYDVDTCVTTVSGPNPSAGEPGAHVAMAGTCLGEELMPGMMVQLQPTGGGPLTSVPIVSWNNTQVVWALPAWVFVEGNYNVFVTTIKWTDADTDGQIDPGELAPLTILAGTFSVTDHPTLTDIIDAAEPTHVAGSLETSGPYYSQLTLTGTGGFGSGSWRVEGGTTEVLTSVVLTASEGSPPGGGAAGSLVVPVGETIGGLVRNSVVSWSNTQIVVNLADLWRDNDGDGAYDAVGDDLVNPEYIHIGDYSVRVRSIYFIDYNGNNLPDCTDIEAPPGTAANELTQICTSDPGLLHLTNTPWIWKAKPKLYPVGGAIKLLGANFGTSIADSVIKIYKADGVTVKKTWGAAQMNLKIRAWGPTLIKVKMPGTVSGTVFWVSVTVNGVESNKVKVRVI